MFSERGLERVQQLRLVYGKGAKPFLNENWLMDVDSAEAAQLLEQFATDSEELERREAEELAAESEQIEGSGSENTTELLEMMMRVSFADQPKNVEAIEGMDETVGKQNEDSVADMEEGEAAGDDEEDDNPEALEELIEKLQEEIGKAEKEKQ